jgi:lipoprotein-anchoring transpeptidase ErfK/SrfK
LGKEVTAEHPNFITHSCDKAVYSMDRRVSIPILPFVLLFLSVLPAHAQSVSLSGPNRTALLEGHSYPIAWTGEGIRSVSLIAYGTRTAEGKRSRGTYQFTIASAVPALQGSIDWKVPWIDSVVVKIKIKAYDDQGQLAGADMRAYEFRPTVMENRWADGLYLDLHRRAHQRLYVQKGKKLVQAYLTTSSMNYLWEPPNRHPNRPHDHAGVFRVLDKSPDHWSKLFHVHMYWALHYLGGHYVHATSRNLYDELGRPASHGCNRLTRYDAHQLYQDTPVGMRVEVIGPEG